MGWGCAKCRQHGPRWPVLRDVSGSEPTVVWGDLGSEVLEWGLRTCYLSPQEARNNAGKHRAPLGDTVPMHLVLPLTHASCR